MHSISVQASTEAADERRKHSETSQQGQLALDQQKQVLNHLRQQIN